MTFNIFSIISVKLTQLLVTTMVYAYKLISVLVIVGLTYLTTNYLISTGVIKVETFPFAVLSTFVTLLTLAVNEIITHLAGLSMENKAMKERELLIELLKEALEPTNVKLDNLVEKVDKVCDNQIALVTELRVKNIVTQTPILTK